MDLPLLVDVVPTIAAPVPSDAHLSPSFATPATPATHSTPSTRTPRGTPTVQDLVPAQLLPYQRDRHIALPVHTTIELLDQFHVVAVPGAAYYCNGLTKWQGQWLPVLDLHAQLHAYRMEHAPKTRYLLVVAYQMAPREPLCHGALALPFVPTMVKVRDAQSCALPEDSDLWPLIALSCFEHEGRPVPVVDTGRLFAGYHG